MKTIRDESGFSMLATLVTLTSVVLIVYSSFDAQQAVAKAQRNTKTSSDIHAYFGRMRSILDTQWTCSASLSGQKYFEAIMLKDPVNPAVTIAAKGMGSGHFWKLAEIQMQNVQSVSGRQNVLRGELVMQFAKDLRHQSGAPILSRSVLDIHFEANAEGVITQCYPSQNALMAAQVGCTIAGGTWNAGLPYGSQCAIPVTAPSPSPSPVDGHGGDTGVCMDSKVGFIGVPNSEMTITGNGEAASNVYLLDGARLTLSGKANLGGALFLGAGATQVATPQATVSSVTQSDRGGLWKSLIAVVTAQSALPPTQKLESIAGTTTISGNGGQNVIQVAGDISLTGDSFLTLWGGSRDRFVFNVTGKITIAGNGGILLSGDVRPENVLFNNVGSGNEIVVTGNGSVSGTFIGLQRGLHVNGNGTLEGAFVAGGGVNTRVTVSGNGLAVRPRPYCLH